MPFDKIHPFTERAVAFLDVLGFSALIREAERQPAKRDELFGIFTVLNDHVKFDNQAVSGEVPNDVKPRYIFISDSINLFGSTPSWKIRWPRHRRSQDYPDSTQVASARLSSSRRDKYRLRMAHTFEHLRYGLHRCLAHTGGGRTSESGLDRRSTSSLAGKPLRPYRRVVL